MFEVVAGILTLGMVVGGFLHYRSILRFARSADHEITAKRLLLDEMSRETETPETESAHREDLERAVAVYESAVRMRRTQERLLETIMSVRVPRIEREIIYRRFGRPYERVEIIGPVHTEEEDESVESRDR